MIERCSSYLHSNEIYFLLQLFFFKKSLNLNGDIKVYLKNNINQKKTCYLFQNMLESFERMVVLYHLPGWTYPKTRQLFEIRRLLWWNCATEFLIHPKYHLAGNSKRGRISSRWAEHAGGQTTWRVTKTWNYCAFIVLKWIIIPFLSVMQCVKSHS